METKQTPVEKEQHFKAAEKHTAQAKATDSGINKFVTVTLLKDYEGVIDRKITFKEPTLDQLSLAHENVVDKNGYTNKLKLTVNIMKLTSNVGEKVIANLPASEFINIVNQAKHFFA